jgi:ferredoxin
MRSPQVCPDGQIALLPAISLLHINVLTRSGSMQVLQVSEGMTLMEALRDSGVANIVALCGGCCSCATCHVYLIEAPADDQKATTGAEEDLLETSQYRKHNSRLACQVQIRIDHDGMTLEVAPED